ncbi:MAG TPA: SIS domain-containing protein [Rhodothermia bacterium]|nr:SIS domain-containing protein [Rhodothermia bacterium]
MLPEERGVRNSCDNIQTQFDAHVETIRWSRDELVDQIQSTGEVLIRCLSSGGKILAFGNGGSATQADHFVGELVGRFQFTRRPLAAVSLPASPGLVTCIANDFGFAELFARQVEALATPGDVAVGLTTSGQSENVLRGLAAARKAGIGSIALTGGGGLTSLPADYQIRVPSTSTARIQEVHLLILHIWCTLIDQTFAKTATDP